MFWKSCMIGLILGWLVLALAAVAVYYEWPYVVVVAVFVAFLIFVRQHGTRNVGGPSR